VKERKCAYVFGDGVAWEIVDKNIVRSFFYFFNNNGSTQKKKKTKKKKKNL
jgi:hypothetical protein